jgi:hypothetical protein
LFEEQQEDLERIRHCNERWLCAGCDMNDDQFCNFDYGESAYSIINALIAALESVPTTEKRDDLVYVCSQFAGDAISNIENAQYYATAIWGENKIPVALHLYFPQFTADDNPNERERALQWCEKAVAMCSEIRVFGNYISDGMKREITAAVNAGVPIRWCEA